MSPENKNITNLVFSGGSVKGTAYVGAIAALEHENLLGSIKKVGGTSGGAIPALLLALGFSVQELVDTLVKLDIIDTFLDEQRNNNDGQLKSSKSMFNCCSPPAETSYVARSIFSEDLHLTINPGTKLTKWLNTVIEKSTLRPNCTFAELHEFVIGKRNVNLLRRGCVFRDLAIVGFNLNSKYAFVFSYESTPDAIISDAVRISMSIPFLFSPWNYYVKDQTRADRRIADGNQDILWIDGGIAHIYPISIFDADNVPKATTLGFYLTSEESLQYEEGESVEKNDNDDEIGIKRLQAVDSAWDYAAAVLQTGMYKTQQKNDHIQSGDSNRTIYIPHLNINSLALRLTTNDKNRLIESGWNAVMTKLHGQENTSQIPSCSVSI